MVELNEETVPVEQAVAPAPKHREPTGAECVRAEEWMRKTTPEGRDWYDAYKRLSHEQIIETAAKQADAIARGETTPPRYLP